MSPPRDGAKIAHADVLARAARRVLVVGVILALGIAIWRERHTLVSALAMDTSILALIASATLGSWATNAVCHHLLLSSLGVRLSLPTLFALHVGGALVNHLPLRAGTAFRAQYLKYRADLRYLHFGSFLLTNTVLSIGATGLFGVLALAIHYRVVSREALLLAGLFFAMSVAALCLIVIPVPTRDPKSWVGRILKDLVAGRDLIFEQRGVLGVLLLAHAMLFAFATLRMSGALMSLDIHIAFAGAMVLGAAGLLSQAVGITPAGIGIQEFVIAATSTVVGIPFSTGLVAAAVLRAVLFGLNVLVGIPCLVWLKRR